MDSVKKKKLNKLIRKSSTVFPKIGPHKNKIIGSKLQKVSAKSQWKQSERKEFTDEQMLLCADMVGLSNVPKESISPLTKHITQIANLIVYGSIRFMEQAKRGTPQSSDIDASAINLGLQVVRGTSSADYLSVNSGGKLVKNSFTNNKPLFFKPEKEIDVKTLLMKDPSSIVYDVSLVAHWLVIDGRQPSCPQNPSPSFLSSLGAIHGKKLSEAKYSAPDKSNKLMHPRSMQTVLKTRQAHEVSQEMMVYFRELTEACVGPSEQRRSEALENVSLDTGLQPLLPHLITFITEGVRVNVGNLNLAILIYLMRLVKALLENPNVSLEPYLHMLIPTVVTCVICRELCAKPITDNHWALRDFAAKQLVNICNKYNTPSNDLYHRLIRQISRALLDWIEARPSTNKSTLQRLEPIVTSPITQEDGLEPGFSTSLMLSSPNVNTNLGMAVNSLNTLYGLIIALTEFGRNTIRAVIFPILPSICSKLTQMVEPNDTQSISGTVIAQKPISSNAVSNTPVLSNTFMSAADVRSYESFRNMIVSKLATLLHEWRIKNNQPAELKDYIEIYGCLGQHLFNSTVAPSSTTTTSLQSVSNVKPMSSINR